MRKVSYLSYNMTTADANNPDGIVPVGRQFDFIGDVETEEMILVDGDESLCLGYEDVKIYQDVYVGDMMEYKATLTHIGNTSRDCRIEVFKLATPAYRAGKEDYKPGDMVWFDEPVLCTEGNVRLVVWSKSRIVFDNFSFCSFDRIDLLHNTRTNCCHLRSVVWASDCCDCVSTECWTSH